MKRQQVLGKNQDVGMDVIFSKRYGIWLRSNFHLIAINYDSLFTSTLPIYDTMAVGPTVAGMSAC